MLVEMPVWISHRGGHPVSPLLSGAITVWLPLCCVQLLHFSLALPVLCLLSYLYAGDTVNRHPFSSQYDVIMLSAPT